MQGHGARDLTQPEDCPHCGVPCRNHMAMWRHKQRCADNADPACRWCGLKFELHKLPNHEQKCPKNSANLPAWKRPRPSFKTFPADRMTPTDLLILPLLAEPGEEPISISEMSQWPRAAPSEEPLVDVQSIDISDISPPKRPTPRTTASRKPRPMPAVAVREDGPAVRRGRILPFPVTPEGALLTLFRLGLASVSSKSSKPEPSPPKAPQARPPYNPMIHGSVEAYCTKYGIRPNRREDEEEDDDSGVC